MATSRVNLSNTSYTDLGTSPCYVQLENNKAIYVIVSANGTPNSSSPGVLVTEKLGGGIDVGFTSQNVYAKALRESTSVIVVR